MLTSTWLDRTDARIVLALNRAPRSTVLALAEELGLSRNTVQARIAKLEDRGALRGFDQRLDPAAAGYPMTAFITARVTQQMLSSLALALADIAEVVEVIGLSGVTDLLIRVVARDATDLYRIAGQILATPGVERTETALAMRTLVESRMSPLLERLASVGPTVGT